MKNVYHIEGDDFVALAFEEAINKRSNSNAEKVLMDFINLHEEEGEEFTFRFSSSLDEYEARVFCLVKNGSEEYCRGIEDATNWIDYDWKKHRRCFIIEIPNAE